MSHIFKIGDTVVSNSNYEIEGKTFTGKSATLHLKAGLRTEITSLPRTVRSLNAGERTVIGVRGLTAYGADAGEIDALIEDISLAP